MNSPIRTITTVLLSAVLVLGCHRETAMADSDRIALGRRIFHDASLSADGRVSCAACHRAEHLFADGRSVSVGAHGHSGTRNAPSLLDVGTLSSLFWDGRESDLDRVVLQPFTNPVEMGLRDLDQLVEKLQRGKTYPLPVRLHASKRDPAADARWIAAALGAYLRTLKSSPSRFQQHLENPTSVALDADEAQGLALFRGKAECASCHRLESATPSFTDQRFHHTGIGFEQVAGKVAPLAAELAALPQRQLAERILSARRRCATWRTPRHTCTTEASTRWKRRWNARSITAALHVAAPSA